MEMLWINQKTDNRFNNDISFIKNKNKNMRKERSQEGETEKK